MEKQQDVIHFSSLDKTLGNLEVKNKELKEFKTLLFGILIGIVISAPIQLLLQPLSYVSNTLEYNNHILADNLVTPIYIIIIVGVGAIVVLFVIVLFKVRVIGIVEFETVQLRYEGDNYRIHQKMRQFIKEESDYLVIKCKAYDDVIKCFREEQRGNNKKPEITEILTIMFDRAINVINLKFRPNDRDSMTLVNKIRYEYLDDEISK